MKSFLHCSFLFLSLSVIISSYTVEVTEKPTFQVVIQGTQGRDLLKEGVSRNEFAPMTIVTDQKEARVEGFDVVLARGSSPIEVFEVAAGNSMDLREFAGSARSGDRLVIEIKKISGIESADLSGTEYIVIIPVK